MAASSNLRLPAGKPPRADADGYQAVYQDDDKEDGVAGVFTPPLTPPNPDRRYRLTAAGLAIALVIVLAFNVYLSLPYLSALGIGSGSGSGSGSCPCKPPKVPQYFQTSPELWAGPTATGKPAFLAQTRTFDPAATFAPNEPLVTSIPVQGMRPGNDSIFKLMGYLSPYFPSPGFGVDEYPLPAGADIVQVQMLSRHGARYPTTGADVVHLGERIANASAFPAFAPRGALAFLRDWRYQLGKEILVPKGRQELFASGVWHAYMYGSLYNPLSRLIVRTTTQDRMLKSAENWLAGFFGLEWTNNATIEVIIEQPGFNNSLGGDLNCPNAHTKTRWDESRNAWLEVYLKDAQSRFNAMTEGFEWTIHDVYAAQNMCPYETVAYGFSMFCGLFTYEEWRDFGYSVDLAFSAGNSFHSPVGRAIGIGYQQEVMARLKNHTLGYSGSQINVTLDSSLETFPLNQSLYFDFSHDTNIVSVLTAFGLRQFADELPSTRYPGDDRSFNVAHMTPFGAHLDIEIIRTPGPLSPNRTGYLRGGETKYVHMMLNQRTIPLGRSFPECDAERKDGWCEFDAFLAVQAKMEGLARYEYACFGDYEAVEYGAVLDGAPN
ncbi:3-phytase A [Escovopsis weberi]|uniref:3-phytase n=1 Tax=Escovopsis weberi TaxID=150374 RepID=A0A0M9VRJ3_ESCWE|nr:3-phytase A [Escovopsis weberi]